MQAPFYHFSIDDVLSSLIEASDSKMPLFEHPLFSFLRDLNESFGTRIDLYLFKKGKIEGRQRLLSEVRDGLATVPRWLRFGPHARDAETPPHVQTVDQQRVTFQEIYREIERITGSSGASANERKSKWLRLHYFSETYEAADCLSSNGVKVLLLTDKEAVSYRLPIGAQAELRTRGCVEHMGLELRRSHLRMENLLDQESDLAVDTALHQHGYVSLFTHECELRRVEVRRALRRCIGRLSETLQSI